MPVLELWRPGVFDDGVANNSIPDANLHTNDIYVCQHTDYPLLDSDIADQDDDVLAVIHSELQVDTRETVLLSIFEESIWWKYTNPLKATINVLGMMLIGVS